MGKIYEVIKAGSTNAVSIIAANYRLISVAFPYECQIGKLVVRQLSVAEGGGTAVAFTYDILNAPAGITVNADIPNATALPAAIGLYKIKPQGSAGAGSDSVEFTPDAGGTGYLFRNMNGTQTVPERKLYLLIRPTAAGTTTKWEFALGAYSDIGG